MADETFGFEVTADASSADRAITAVENKLTVVEGKAYRAGKAIEGAFQDKNGKWRDASGKFLTLGNEAERAGAKIKRAGDVADDAGKKAGRAAKGFSELGAALAGLGLAAAAKVGFDFAESYANLSNRIRTVAKDQENLNGLMDATRKVANDTRANWAVVGEAFVRFTNAAKPLGKSQQDILGFTETYGKTVKLAGASTAEATTAIQQLGQALGKGRLDGDELKSIAEAAPKVIDVIAAGMGKSRGEIKKLGSEGKITADVIFDAFEKAAPDIAKQFEKVIPTVSDMFVVFKNEAMAFFGEAGAGSGTMRFLAEAVGYVAANMDTFGRIAIVAVQALGGLFIVTRIIALFALLGSVIAANPFTALVFAVTTIVLALRQFGDRMDSAVKVTHNGQSVFATVGDRLRALWGIIKDVGASIYEFVSGAWNELTSAFSNGVDGEGIQLSLRNILTFLASFVDVGIGIIKFFASTVVTVFGGIPVVIGEALIDVGKKIATMFEQLINTILSGIEKFINAVAEMNRGIIGDIIGTSTMQGVVDRMYVAKGLAKDGKADMTGMLGRVDFQFANPLDGAWDALKAKFEEDVRKVGETNTAKDAVGRFMDKWDSRTGDEANGRLDAPARGSSVSDAAGDRTVTAAADEKAAKALQKLRDAYMALVASSNPIAAAQIKLAEAQTLVNKALEAGVTSPDEAAEVMDNLRKKYADALDPFGAMLEALGSEYNALTKSTEAREHDARVRELVLDLERKGISVTEAQTAAIERSVTAIDKRRAAMEKHEAMMQRASEYAKDQAEDAAKATEKARADEVAADAARAKAADIGQGFKSGLRAIRDEYGNVAKTIETSMVGALQAIEGAMLETMQTGEFSWRKWGEAALQEINRIILRMAIAGLVNGIAGAFGGSTAAPITAAVVNQYTGSGGGNVVTGGPATAQRTAPSGGGGSERRAASSDGGGMSVTILNYDDERALLQPIGSREGAKQVFNTMRKSGVGRALMRNP